jgi:hypothetical protein
MVIQPLAAPETYISPTNDFVPRLDTGKWCFLGQTGKPTETTLFTMVQIIAFKALRRLNALHMADFRRWNLYSLHACTSWDSEWRSTVVVKPYLYGLLAGIKQTITNHKASLLKVPKNLWHNGVVCTSSERDYTVTSYDQYQNQVLHRFHKKI